MHFEAHRRPVHPTAGYSQSDLLELRAQALRAIVVPTAVAALLWQALGTVDVQPVTWIGPLVLLFACVVALWLHGSRHGLAVGAYVTGAIGAGVVALRVDPESPASALLSLVVFSAAVLLAPRAGLAAAVGVTMALALAALATPGRAALGHLTTPLALAWCAAGLSWLAARPVQAALDWAWGSYLDALRHATELRDRQGELNRALKSLSEAYYRLERVNEELERARQAAAEARRLKAEFAASISHELRTPLNLIIGYSEVMTISPASYGGQTLPPAYRDDIAAIYRNANHLASLIDDVLDLSQIDAGRMGLRREDASLARIVEEAAAAVQGLFHARGLALHVDVPPGLPTLRVDPTRIRQILINLLGNAVRFTERGYVRVAATSGPTGDGADREAAGHEVLVTVADTGAGIAPADLARVFDEFRHFAGPDRRGNSGLGLTISKRFVEMHGGAMWATSSLGEGTTFCFTLPLADQVVSGLSQPAWQTWARVPGAANPARRVLVLDQEQASGDTFARYLDGYEVLTAHDDGELRRLAAEYAPQAVLLAASAQGGGADRCRLPAELSALPVLACDLSGSRSAARRLAVAEYLVKPVTRDRLRTVLQRLDRPGDAESGGGRRRDLLVVDDDPEMVRLLSRLLRSLSRRYRVWEATNGEAGLATMRKQRPDVVLLDLVMPGLDGYAVLEQMRADPDLQSIPVVVITARGHDDETILATSLEISQPEGLPVGLLMGCVRAALDVLLGAPDSARAPTAGPAG